MFGQKLQKWGFWVFISAIIFFMVAYFIFGDDVSTETLRQSIKDFGIWAPLLFIVLYIIGTIFIPSTPFMVLAGLLFGLKYGIVYSLIGGSISSILVFEISRKLGKTWVEGVLEYKYFKLLKKYNERLGTGAVWDLFLLRITPIMPFNVLNILMGVSRINVRDYMLGTILGLIPSKFITVYAGVIIAKII